MVDRRKFLLAAALGAGSGVLSPALLNAVESVRVDSRADDLDEETLRFWNDKVRNASTKPHAFGNTRQQDVSADDRSAEFMRVGKDGKLQTLEQVDNSELLPAGDVAVQVTVHGFRPSQEDADHFERVKGGSLRIDFQQAKSIHPLIDNLAWTTVGALFPSRSGKLPPLSELKFDPGTSWGNTKNILLPGGAGSWTLNFFLQKEDSFLCKLSRYIVKGAATFAPALGFPGMAVTALKSFDSVFGYMQAMGHTEKWILKNQDLKVYATEEAANSLDRGTSLPLVTGDYLVVPRAQLPQIAGMDFASLRLRRGWVVPQDTKSEFVFEAARSTAPDLTYLSFNVNVKKV